MGNPSTGRKPLPGSIIMKLHDLCEVFEARHFPTLGTQAHPERDAVRDARSAVADAVVDDEFLADCLSWELRLVKENRLRRGLAPFFTIPELGVRFAFGYWPPGSSAGPHEHTAWTITAVCRNELEVVVYNREESYQRRELVPKNCFHAPSGRVGFIYEPCIHDPRNTSPDWSLTLHITSPRDGEPPPDHREPLPVLVTPGGQFPEESDHPYTHVLVARQRQIASNQLARILASMDVPQAPDLLAQCYEMASTATRGWIDRSARNPTERRVGDSQWVLARTHRDLVFRPRADGETIALEVETMDGPIDDIVISDEAHAVHAAIDFVAREPIFDVRELPGNLSWEEQSALGDELEATGLFTRVRP